MISRFTLVLRVEVKNATGLEPFTEIEHFSSPRSPEDRYTPFRSVVFESVKTPQLIEIFAPGKALPFSATRP
jgi:hypothetical protein